ncbi:MAG: alpha/beta hydrolase domain-containing protein [Vicinamibacterales bacterium]
MKRTCFVLIGCLGLAGSASADVSRVEVKTRAAVGASGYEKVSGTVHFALDPKDPHNRVIEHLDRAPLGPGGKVEFSSNFYLLRPIDAARSNGIALVEVSNRGRKGMLPGFNRGPAALDPSTDADLGDGFLLRRGFTLAWVGWQFDVPAAGGPLMGLQAPHARSTSVVVRAEFTPGERATQFTVADLAGYPSADPGGPDTILTVRDAQFGPRQTVDRAAYAVRANVVSMAAGFEPGLIYEVSWRTADPAIAGAGLAAFRDFGAWLKSGAEGFPAATQAIAWGSSQSGRFLRTFLYYGFNADERGRQVFDGVMAHIAGAARLSINEREATPNALSMWTATGFPYADAAAKNPITGAVDGLLDNDRARGHQPKVFYTNSAVEYWGGGRSAALVHTSPDGASDLTLPDNVRVYYLTGTSHSPSRFPPRVTQGQQAENPVEYWWTLRALLVAMEAWVRDGALPPASQYPRLSDGTLVPAAKIAFPAIPGVASPRTIPGMRIGDRALPLLVPQVDGDGNERAGIRTPEIAVPVATYTGWNFRRREIGGPSLLVGLMGASIPFAPTRAARAAGDGRRSIAERYPSDAQYSAASRTVADALVAGRYLLAEDVPAVMKRAADQWALAQSAQAPVGTAARR